MKDIIVQSFCDMCMDEKNVRVHAIQTRQISINGEGSPPTPHIIDLCDVHGDTILALRELLLKLPEPDSFRARVGRPPVADADRTAHNPMEMCRVCGAEIRHNSMVGHIWNVHRKGEKRPRPTACPDCGYVGDISRVGIHRARAHGWSPVDDSLIGLVRE